MRFCSRQRPEFENPNANTTNCRAETKSKEKKRFRPPTIEERNKSELNRFRLHGFEFNVFFFALIRLSLCLLFVGRSLAFLCITVGVFDVTIRKHGEEYKKCIFISFQLISLQTFRFLVAMLSAEHYLERRMLHFFFFSSTLPTAHNRPSSAFQRSKTQAKRNSSSSRNGTGTPSLFEQRI